MLEPSNVSSIFYDCLFDDTEIVNEKPIVETVIVEGITKKVGFHKERLESHKNEIIKMLDELSSEFQPASKGGGGGWTFLNICDDKNSRQWTGMHSVMEELCLLAIGLNLAEFLLTREFWSSFPGNMPYFSIKDY